MAKPLPPPLLVAGPLKKTDFYAAAPGRTLPEFVFVICLYKPETLPPHNTYCLVKNFLFSNLEWELHVFVMIKAVSNKDFVFLKSCVIMVRTQALFNDFCVAWLNLHPPPSI